MSLAAPVTAGQFEDGLTTFKRGDDATARRLMRPLHDPGDAHAKNVLGSRYAQGKDVQQTQSNPLTPVPAPLFVPEKTEPPCGVPLGTKGISVDLHEGGPAYAAAMVAAAEEIGRAEQERIRGGGDYTIKAAFVGRDHRRRRRQRSSASRRSLAERKKSAKSIR